MNFQFEIEKLIEAYSSNPQPIVQFRFRKLNAMKDYYTTNGYPKPCTISELSLFSAFFQEAIYDGINWSDQNAELEHLAIALELDCIFHNCGRTRKELSPKEFEDYMNFTAAAINRTSPKPKNTIFSWLLAKLGLSI